MDLALQVLVESGLLKSQDNDSNTLLYLLLLDGMTEQIKFLTGWNTYNLIVQVAQILKNPDLVRTLGLTDGQVIRLRCLITEILHY